MSLINEDEFRVCPKTNFRVFRKAEPLMIANAVVAVLALAIGGVAALIMGIHKMPIRFSFIDNSTYYQVVNIHGINMLILWIVWFEIAAVYFASTAMLNSKMASMRLGWGAFALMLLGTLMLEWTIFFDHPNSTVMFTAYVPLKANPFFYLGYILFAVGVLVAGINFFLTIYQAQKTKSYPHESLPLAVYGVFVAVVIAVQAIINGAIVMILAYLYSYDIIAAPNADFWKQVFWGFGHTAQYINISATAAVWYILINIATGAKPLNEKYSRFAFMGYLLFTVPVATHHLIVDPAYSMPFKLINATLIALALAVPSLIHAFVIPGALERQIREKNHSEGLFSWLRELPWNEPAIPAVIWGILLFGIGGMLGSIQGTYQLNMITHNTLRINAHFHLTVVAGTTMAFMGLAYYFIELIPARKIIGGNLKVIQLHLFALGLAILTLGMFIAGVQGAPRRTATYDYYTSLGVNTFAWQIGLWLLGIGAIITVTGGALFVGLIVISLFFGKKVDKEGSFDSPIPTNVEEEEAHTNKLEAPGSMSIGFVFMIAFIVFYMFTFLVLSRGWKIGVPI